MKKESRIDYLIKNTGILTIGSFASKIVVFLLVPLYTGILSTAEYGIYDLSITTIQLLAPVFSLNITDGILRFSLDSKNRTRDVANAAIKYLIISVLVFTTCVFICRFFNLLPTYNAYYRYILLYYVAFLGNAFFLQIAKSSNQIRAIAISGVIGTFFLAISCIYFLKYTNRGLEGFYIANIIGQIAPIIYYCIALKVPSRFKEIRIGANRELEIRMKNYSVPLILTTIGWWVNSSSDKYIISLICGVSANGLLSIAYKIPNIISVLAGIFNQAWQISAIKEYDSENAKKFYNEVFEFVIGMIIICGATLILVNKFLASILFSNEFYEAWKYVPALIISSIFTTAAGMIAPILSAQYKTKPIALSSVVGLSVNLVLNITLALAIQIQGVVIATALSSFIIFLIRYIATADIFEKAMVLRMCGSMVCSIGISILQIAEFPFFTQVIPFVIMMLFLQPTLVNAKNSILNYRKALIRRKTL